jgi:hypothetical protein
MENTWHYLVPSFGTSSNDYEAYLRSKCKYLEKLHVEPPKVVQTADYIEHLSKLYHLQYAMQSLVY